MRRQTSKGRVRIQKRIIRKRYGGKEYQSPLLTMTIPAQFHSLFERLLDFEFEVDVKDYGTFLLLTLVGRNYEELNLLDVNLALAKERKLELVLRVRESPDMQKQRSSYWGVPIPVSAMKKYPDADSPPF